MREWVPWGRQSRVGATPRLGPPWLRLGPEVTGGRVVTPQPLVRAHWSALSWLLLEFHPKSQNIKLGRPWKTIRSSGFFFFFRQRNCFLDNLA